MRAALGTDQLATQSTKLDGAFEADFGSYLPEQSDIPRMAEMISRGWEAGVKALDREAARKARP